MNGMRYLPRFESLEDRTLLDFGPPTTYAVQTLARSIAMVDLNGDGKPDVVTANYASRSASVLLGNGDGTFRPAANIPVNQALHSVAVGDFNSDGKPDLVFASESDMSATVLLGNGDGTFRSQRAYPVGMLPHSVAVGDFNGDGKLDIVTANSGESDVSILLGNGDGTFKPARSIPCGPTPQWVTVGDFAGNGKLDLAVANHVDNGTVTILMGNGDGTFQSARTLASGSLPFSIVTGDFDHDGKVDLAVANKGTNNVSVFLGNGDGTFKPVSYYPVGPNPSGIATADFDHNGKLDLVTSNSSATTISVLTGNGDGSFQPKVDYNVGPNPISVAVGDLRGNSLPDLMVGYNSTSYISVLPNLTPLPTHFRTTSPPVITAGNPLQITVNGLDQFNHVVQGYRGTIHFTSTDPQAILPADYTFTAADDGTHTFSVTLRTASSQTISVADTLTGSINGSATTSVNPAAAQTLLVAEFPTQPTAGDIGGFTVTALDAYGNIATGYRGTVTFSSSDSQATLPSDYTFNTADNGSHPFGAILVTAGTQTISATDTADPTISGTQAGITVSPAAAASFYVQAPDTAVAGMPFDFTLYALDAYGNVATGYTGTASFYSNSDPQAILPADYTFTPDDAGMVFFPARATFFAEGVQDLSVYDTASGIGGVTYVNVIPGGSPSTRMRGFAVDWLFDSTHKKGGLLDQTFEG